MVNDQAAFKAQCHAIRYDFCLVLRRKHRNRNFMGVVDIDFLVGGCANSYNAKVSVL